MKWCIPALIVLTFIFGCKRKCSDTWDYYSLFSDVSIVLEIKDENGNNLLSSINPAYKTSHIKVYDSNMDSLRFHLIPLPGDTLSRLSIDEIITGADLDYNKEISKRIFIDFKTDRDTIDYSFTIHQDECGPVLNSIKVTFNNKEIKGESDMYGFEGEIIK